jgi:23S rRNA pseudouridine1911/1915/1917 synthase
MTPDERRRPQPEPVELTVLYEDDAVIAVDKPAGQVVHPTYKNTSGTLLNGVLWRYRNRPGVQPGILTRLDKGTSGVVLIALTPELHARLQKGRIEKEYFAVVRGRPDPPHGTITLPLARDLDDRRRVVVSERGQASETRYSVDRGFRLPPSREASADRRSLGGGGQAEDVSVVKCTPVTGRTHQIRVHLAAIGCPVIGDATYGQADERIARQALHAWRVSVWHPLIGQPLRIEAPLPDDIRALLS